MRLLIQWLLSTVILLGGSYLIPGVKIDSFFTGLWVTLIVGLANVTVKPLLILLSLPVTILTFGLFIFVINAVLLLGAAKLVDGFMIQSFWSALLLALFVAVANTLLRLNSTN